MDQKSGTKVKVDPDFSTYKFDSKMFEEALDSMGGFVSEANVVEDKLTDKKIDNDFVKKDKKEIGNKVERVADLLAKLPKNDLDKLMTLLEAKKKK